MQSVFYVILAVASYFASYPSEASSALDFFDGHRSEFIEETKSLTASERRMAAAIVAPEVSQYSKVTDFFELRSLFAVYLYQGKGDFSVGIFQMKPSFAERMEKELLRNSGLSKRYAAWLREIPRDGSETDRRRARLRRLGSTQWQMRYLVIFMETARNKTSGIRFASDEDRLLHYATLYNSGIDITPVKVAEMKERKLFPHGARTHNYASVALEFFRRLRF